MDKIVRS